MSSFSLPRHISFGFGRNETGRSAPQVAVQELDERTLEVDQIKIEAAVALKPFADSLLLIERPSPETAMVDNSRREWSMALGKLITRSMGFLPKGPTLLIQPLARNEVDANSLEELSDNFVADLGRYRRLPPNEILVAGKITVDTDVYDSPQGRGFALVKELTDNLRGYEDERVMVLTDMASIGDISSVTDVHSSSAYRTENVSPSGLVFRAIHSVAARGTRF